MPTSTPARAAGATARRLPSHDERDNLIHVVFAHDPRPSACEQHRNPRIAQDACGQCKATVGWLDRTHKRFRTRGLILSLDPPPPPPPCPQQHTGIRPAADAGCRACRLLLNWNAGERKRQRRAGHVAAPTDWDALRHHVKLLREAGMSLRAIARASGCGTSSIQRVLRDATEQHTMGADLARRILDVPLPERRFTLVSDRAGAVRRRVDATGTHRRLQAAARAGHSISEQARRLGYTRAAGSEWLRHTTVTIEVATAVAGLFPRLIARPGGDAAAAAAARKGWAPAGYYSAITIDDPTYDPYQILRNPAGVYRRLRALAWDGNGPRQVAPFIGETVKTVTSWLRGGPAPAYAVHLLDTALEKLPFPGPDTAIAARARRQRWASAMAWHDINIDSPYAQPHVNVVSGYRKTDDPLHSQVFQALIGLVPAAELLREEKISVVRILHRAGWSDRRIGVWLRWSDDPRDGLDAVCHFRSTWDITGGGPAIFQWGANRDDDHIVLPAA